MKLCFIDWFAYGLFNPQSKIVFGGAQIQLYLIAQELSKNRKFKIYFLTDNFQNNRIERSGKINVYQFFRDRWLFGNWQFFVRLFLQMEKINANFFIQRAASAETGIIALIAKILRRKFIYMVAHEQDVSGEFIRKNGWRGKLFWLGLKLADKIICQTSDQQQRLEHSLKTKSLVIRSGFPLQTSLKISQRDVLWVARAEDWKQPEMFIRLARNFPEEKFTMVCPQSENNPEYFKTIKNLAKRVSNLSFIDQVPFKRIQGYFGRARVFVSTSLAEGFPNTFIQAALSRMPILSFKVDPDKIIERYRIGFCAGGNEAKLTEYLRKLIKNNRLRRDLGINAFNYAQTHHDIKRTATDIVAGIAGRQTPRKFFG